MPPSPAEEDDVEDLRPKRRLGPETGKRSRVSRKEYEIKTYRVPPVYTIWCTYRSCRLSALSPNTDTILTCTYLNISI